MKLPMLLPLVLALGAPGAAAALELRADKVEVSFHIEHPAKEYDAFLRPGGGVGVITLDPQAIESTRATFTIKVDHLDSENTRRDSHMMEVLEGLVHPTIVWTVQSVQGAAGPLKPGVTRVTATGPITIHGVTKPLSVPLEVTVGGKGELAISASFAVSLETFGIERPTLVFVPIEDVVPIVVRVETAANPAVLAPPTPAPSAPVPAPEASP